MNKTEAIQELIGRTVDEPIIFTTGYTCRIAKHLADRPNHFYMTGSMGLAGPIGAGVALSSGRRAIVVDGDGSLTMNPAALITAGAIPDLPLLHLVLDDGLYESTGGQGVPAERVDFGALARATGRWETSRVADLRALGAALRRALRERATASFIHCVLDSVDPAGPPPRVEADLRGHQLRFRTHLERMTALQR